MEHPLREAIPASKALRARAFNGWALRALSRCDEEYSGILRFALFASAFRRQAMFLLLAFLDRDRPEELADRLGCAKHSHLIKTIAEALVTRRVGDLVTAAFGQSQGLLGALKKLGDLPLPLHSYQVLPMLFSEPEHRERAKVLRQMSQINETHLTVICGLEPPFIIQDLVENLTVEGLHQFRATVALILRLVPEATAEDLAHSIRAAADNTTLQSLAERWLTKAKDFPLALTALDNAEFHQLRSGEAIRNAALRFRNCLRNKTTEAALGHAAYVEYLPIPAIIKLVALTENRWVVEGIYGPSQDRVDDAVARDISQKLEAAGALIPLRHHADGEQAKASFFDVSEPFDDADLDFVRWDLSQERDDDD
ncbi:hypothetical protein MHY87_03475 [Microvirga sp. ACRRW]|uniref:hypothetical protein n=1 Tax=Microvirga sp. ACRRW TaxID=2918205 RepID=UPI001EF7496F|nr:hypothetical protein [Microvirga sp. ACRRW]MCG7391966.1 hypothetical protein [Microvirga sp. ACRRW]